MEEKLKVNVGGIHGWRRNDQSDKQLRVVACRPGSGVSLAVSTQQEASRDHYIVRHGTIPETPFLGEYMTTVSYEKAYIGGPIRLDTLSYRELLLRYREQHAHEGILGFAGCANVTMNPRFVAYVEGRLLYTEPDLSDKTSSFHRANPSIVVRKAGAPTFAQVRYELTKKGELSVQPGAPKILRSQQGEFSVEIEDSHEAFDDVRFIVQGPPLVRNGRPINEGDLVRMAKDGWFYDLRHVIQFPWVKWRGKDDLNWLSVSVGLENMWASGEIVKGEVEKALQGQPVHVDLRPYEDKGQEYVEKHGKPIGIDPIEEALDAQSYRSSADPRSRGEYRINRTARQLTICSHEGIYNHSILGLSNRNELIWLAICGRGGRVGVTMLDAAQLAAQNGMHNALLIDNGGDVMLNIHEEWIARSAHERTRLRGLLLFTAPALTAIPVGDGYVPVQPLLSE
jgi:hypothetical protein